VPVFVQACSRLVPVFPALALAASERSASTLGAFFCEWIGTFPPPEVGLRHLGN